MASGPIMIATPQKPIKTPAILFRVIFSSAVRKCATMTPKSGVVALRMEASPLAIWVCPQTMRQKGSRLLRKPIPKNASHTRRSFGSDRPIMRINTTKASAASPTRSVTILKGGNSRTAMPLKKNEPPQRTERTRSIAHSFHPIIFCAVIFKTSEAKAWSASRKAWNGFRDAHQNKKLERRSDSAGSKRAQNTAHYELRRSQCN